MKFNKSKSTLAIYGIKDKKNSGYSVFFNDPNRAFFDKGRIISHTELEKITEKMIIHLMISCMVF